MGVYIDERLAWDKHIQQVAHKMSRSVGMLQKLKYTIPQSSLMLLYNSLIISFTHICCTAVSYGVLIVYTNLIQY